MIAELAARWRATVAGQTGLLFLIDLVTNSFDYLFHLALGWYLQPGQFATLQSFNSVLLILLTAFAVRQPVVARTVAEQEVLAERRALLGGYLRGGLWWGLVIALLFLFLRLRIANILGLPDELVVMLAGLAFVAVVRPILLGYLQGVGRFAAYGLTRFVNALSRLLLVGGFLLLGGLVEARLWRGGLTFVAGAYLSLLAAFFLIDIKGLPFRKQHNSRFWVRLVSGRAEWGLSLAALFAYAAYMGLLNNDLIWVNRVFGGEVAGGYATAVVLRRLLAILPGAVTVVIFPRLVRRCQQGQPPDRLLATSGLLLVGLNGLAALLLYLVGPPLIPVFFGPAYGAERLLLGHMGLAMVAYGLVALWLNLYLASRPWFFVWLLVGGAVGQVVALSVWGQGGTTAVAAIFHGSGWLLAGGGLLLYLLYLRPSLAAGSSRLRPGDENR